MRRRLAGSQRPGGHPDVEKPLTRYRCDDDDGKTNTHTSAGLPQTGPATLFVYIDTHTHDCVLLATHTHT